MPREILCRMLFNADEALRGVRTPWSKVVGPASAALASCFRIGWTLGTGVGKLCTADGEVLDLCRECPRTVRMVAQWGVEAWLLDKARCE
eukprot:1944464-Pyramimonas_sp.AAC.1